MKAERFDKFLKAAFAREKDPDFVPFDYQRRLACGERNDRPEENWLRGGTTCASKLIDIPTGLGQTAAVVLAWLTRRLLFMQAFPQTPNNQNKL